MRINYKKHKLPEFVIIFFAVAIMTGCTKKFEEYNTNPNLLTGEQSLSLAHTVLGPLQNAVFADYQVTQNLSADAFCGYMMSPTNFVGGNNNLKYSFVDGWNARGFTHGYNLVMAPVKKLAEAGARTTIPDIWGVALTWQVFAMDRVTDRFGPIPYTQAGTSLTSIPYDNQKTVYQAFFNQLDTAVANLQSYIANPDPARGAKPMGAFDLIYGGDYNQWLKFANSLRLRLAMRLSKVDPTLAKQQGEIALNAPGGLLIANSDNAFLKQSAGRNNDYWLITFAYGFDNMTNANISTYVTGYNDPRAAAFFTTATNAAVNGQYVGIRLGADVSTINYRDLSTYNYNTSFSRFTSQAMMTCSEIWFLKAEAALRGWNGAGDAKTNYETGVQRSMEQWGVTIGNYLDNSISKQADYIDPRNAANNISAKSDITIKWNSAATKEQNLERIMIQKWLALFPDGQEAWADQRRTGYPKLFPVVENLSNGTVDSQIGARRIPYPLSESASNPKGLEGGIGLLGGPDNGGIRLWWDTGGPNF